MTTTTTPAAARPRRRRLMAVGVVAAGLSVVGAGAAAAANPYSGGARAIENVAQAVGIDWSAMPDGYTRAQYEAFWGAGYTADDVDKLGALWTSDATETKARAGQLILDGAALPLTPGVSVDTTLTAGTGGSTTTVDYTQAQYDAFWGAGYTVEDIQSLNALWNSDATETKARAGQLILDGQTPPVAPSGTPVTGTAP